MRKFLISTFVLVVLSPVAVNAVPITISGFDDADGQWEVTLLGPTTYSDNAAELQSQIWWDDIALALEFSNLVNSALGTPNEIGPLDFVGPIFLYALETRDGGDIVGLFWDGGSTEQTGSTFETDVLTFAVARRIEVPEPGTLALLGIGLVAMAARRRKRV